MDSLLSISGLVGLHDLLDELPIDLRLVDGPFVAGGAIVRALAGLPLRDVDIWIQEDWIGDVEVALGETGWTQVARPAPSFGRRSLWRPHRGGGPLLDFVVSEDGPAEVTARFDWRCCMLATDGRELFHRPWALDDVASRRLTPQRRTTAARLEKYQAMGFSMLRDTVEVLLPEDATREERLGRMGVSCG